MGMTRGVPAPMMAAIASGIFYPIAMVYLDWPGDAVRVHSGVGPIDTLGARWLGVGAFGAIDVPAESFGLVAARATLTLMGVPPEIFARLDDPIRNRPGAIYFGITTKPGGNSLVSEPISMFAGYMDAMRYTIQPEGEDLIHAVQVDLGSGPSARAAASVVHSPEDQKRKFPGDTAGRHLIGIEAATENITWPM